MNYKLVTQFLGKIIMLEAVFMIPSMIVSLIYKQGDTEAFILSILIALITGFFMSQLKPKRKKMFARDGMMIVSLAWLLLGFFGAMPAFISGAIPNFIDAYFESISGFTTTGSSILREVESLPKGILFWRSLTHWFGGMGVLVFSLILFPSMSGQTQHLMRAESPGPSPSKLVPKIKESSKILYAIYAVLTILCIVALIIAGMPVYDAFIHGFGAAGTGGFSNKNASVAYYNSYTIDMILSVFMILFGVNFTVYFLGLKNKWRDILRNGEVKLFLIIIAIATLLITGNIWNICGNGVEAFRQAFFQVSTIISTTGYATADFNLWPAFSKMILLILMFLGSCAGSTAGGFKQIRLLILIKATKRSANRLTHPRSVMPVRTEGKTISDEQVMGIGIFAFLYVAFMGVAMVCVSIDNFDMETTATAVLATISNIGPGLGMVGSTGNFADFSDFSKIILSICMVAGRLEIFPILILFRINSWRRH